MRKEYHWVDKDSSLHCQVMSRIVQGNTIIDHEHITYGGSNSLNGTVIYNVEGNKIKKVFFIQ
jgi:hypothetical protein